MYPFSCTGLEPSSSILVFVPLTENYVLFMVRTMVPLKSAAPAVVIGIIVKIMTRAMNNAPKRFVLLIELPPHFHSGVFY